MKQEVSHTLILLLFSATTIMTTKYVPAVPFAVELALLSEIIINLTSGAGLMDANSASSSSFLHRHHHHQPNVWSTDEPPPRKSQFLGYFYDGIIHGHSSKRRWNNFQLLHVWKENNKLSSCTHTLACTDMNLFLSTEVLCDQVTPCHQIQVEWISTYLSKFLILGGAQLLLQSAK